jgi:nitrate reductase delta subunit
MSDGELPDHLSVLLEFASTQPAEQSLALLQEVAHILNSIFSALARRASPYASVIAAVLELAGETPHAIEIPADRPLDTEWAEPPAFDGCSKEGQASPGQAQPIHIVRKPRAESEKRDPHTGARP